MVTCLNSLAGHAFEARIYAENVPKGFLPATGVLHHYNPVPTSSTGTVYLRSWCLWTKRLRLIFWQLLIPAPLTMIPESWFISSLVLIKTALRNKTIHASYWNPNYPSSVYLFGLVMLSLAGQGTMQVRYTFVWKVFVEDNPTSC